MNKSVRRPLNSISIPEKSISSNPKEISNPWASVRLKLCEFIPESVTYIILGFLSMGIYNIHNSYNTIMEKRVPFNELPYDIRNRLIKNKDSWLSKDESPEGSKWVFRKVHLDDLFYIASTTPNDRNEEERINKYKKECLERRCCITLIVWESMSILIDGYHHLTAFREAVDEDDTIIPIIECWVLVDSF